MAVDSRNKRASAINLPWGSAVYPSADSVVTIDDRMQTGGEYALPNWKSADDVDTSDGWDNPANAYDGDIATFASQNVANSSNPLILSWTPIRTDKVRFLGHDVDIAEGEHDASAVAIYVFHNNAWHKHGPLLCPQDEWYEYFIGNHLVSKVKIVDEDLTDYLYVGEIQLLDSTDQYPSITKPKVDGGLTRNSLITGGLVR